MSLYLILLIDVLVIWAFFGSTISRQFMTAARQLKVRLKDSEHALLHHLQLNRDLLPPAQIRKLEEEIFRLHAARRRDPGTDPAAVLQSVEARWEQLAPPAKHAGWREILEIGVVAFTLAFSFRSLLLQPFKIPTSSMQPTLFGIHFTPAPAETKAPNPAHAAWDYVHYSRRWLELTVQQPGRLEQVRPTVQAIPILNWLRPATIVRIGGVDYELPGEVTNVVQALHESCPAIPEWSPYHWLADRDGNGGVAWQPAAEQGPEFTAGQTVAKGWMESGDHLFVNRLSFAFGEPRRGDITVFITDNLGAKENSPLSGRWYIKRLAGLPGDTLRIRDHKLYVKPVDAAEFKLIDGTDAPPAYHRIYGFQGGYRGYCHLPNSRYLRTDDETFTLGPDEYFMLGDNSERSSDSRFWGVVPRANLVGRASFAWWPFSRRWGLTDRAEPETFPSPSNFPDRPANADANTPPGGYHRVE